MMKEKSIKFVVFLLSLFFIATVTQAKDKENENQLNYDIMCGGSGSQGFYIVKVSAYVDKSSQIDEDIVRKCAVHGVLFRGFSGEQGCTSQRSLAGSALVEQQHADFFTVFFVKGGRYASYASMVTGSLQTERSGKKYKVTAVVSVAKDQLRKDLEQAGVIKGLSNGF